MTEWDQCSVCGEPTTAGLVCYRCAAERIESERKGKTVSVVVDGRRIRVPKKVAEVMGKHPAPEPPACPVCGREWDLRRCACGWTGGE